MIFTSIRSSHILSKILLWIVLEWYLSPFRNECQNKKSSFLGHPNPYEKVTVEAVY